LRAGHRVAVCEQLEEASGGKKIIRREVNRVVTPGTVTEDELLDPRRANHLAAVVRVRGGSIGLAWVDLSTGYFHAMQSDIAQLPDELSRLGVAECLLADGSEVLLEEAVRGFPCTRRPGWTFDPTTTLETLRRHFAVRTFAGFGFQDDSPALVAAGAVFLYLQETLQSSLAHLQRLRPYEPARHLRLDEVTRRSLELTRTLRDHSREGSLLSVMDRTVTPMGARLLQEQLLAPLIDRVAIEARLDGVEEFLREHGLRQQTRELLNEVADLHRLASRCATARATPKDLAALRRTLALLPAFAARLAGVRSPLLQQLHTELDPHAVLFQRLQAALHDDPPYSTKEGGIIRPGFHAELDELRRLATDGKSWIAQYQASEIARTGINSLKVAYTQVIGYY
ncbi:MAG: DNA mismatch repair protein MutS, partial [Gemmataceae bacterium]